MKTKIIVSRKWDKPEIEVFATSAIGAKMDVNDFLSALVEEMGNPTMLLTKAQMKAKMIAASEVVIREMKSTTVHVL